MTRELKEKGWQQMKHMLDKELPERKRRYVLPFWVAGVLLCTAFIGGYYLSESTREFSKTSMASVIPSTETSVKNQLDRIMANPDIMPHSQQKIKDKLKFSGIMKSRQFSEKLPKANTTDTYINLPALHSETKEPNTTLPADPSLQKETNPGHAQATTEDREKMYFTKASPTVFSCYTAHKLIPSLQITEVTPIKLAHQLSFSTGSGFKSSNIISGSISYNLLLHKNKLAWHGGMGYRYIHMDYHNNLNQKTIQDAGNVAVNDQQVWSLYGLHQVFTDIGVRREWRKSWFAGVGLTVPINVAYKSSSNDELFGGLESNPSTGSGNPNFTSSSPKSASVRNWDIQPYITLGKNISSDISIFSVIRAGLASVNTLPLENGKDVRLHEISVGVHYVL